MSSSPSSHPSPSPKCQLGLGDGHHPKKMARSPTISSRLARKRRPTVADRSGRASSHGSQAIPTSTDYCRFSDRRPRRGRSRTFRIPSSRFVNPFPSSSLGHAPSFAPPPPPTPRKSPGDHSGRSRVPNTPENSSSFLHSYIISQERGTLPPGGGGGSPHLYSKSGDFMAAKKLVWLVYL